MASPPPSFTTITVHFLWGFVVSTLVGIPPSSSFKLARGVHDSWTCETDGAKRHAPSTRLAHTPRHHLLQILSSETTRIPQNLLERKNQST